MEINDKTIKSLAIEVLDTDHGISHNAWTLLRSMLILSGNEDVVGVVEGLHSSDRAEANFYLGEDDVEDLRNSLEVSTIE